MAAIALIGALEQSAKLHTAPHTLTLSFKTLNSLDTLQCISPIGECGAALGLVGPSVRPSAGALMHACSSGLREAWPPGDDCPKQEKPLRKNARKRCALLRDPCSMAFAGAMQLYV